MFFIQTMYSIFNISHYNFFPFFYKQDSLDSDSDLDLEGEDDGSEVSDDDQDLENLSDLKIATAAASRVDSDNDF